MDLGDYGDSERTFDTLLEMDPKFVRGHLDRGKLRILRQDWPDAGSDFAAVAAAVPDQPEAHYYLGVCLQQMHEWKKAQGEFARAGAIAWRIQGRADAIDVGAAPGRTEVKMWANRSA